jgi:hypothetical protein
VVARVMVIWHARVRLLICNAQDNALSKEPRTQIVIPAKAGIHFLRDLCVLCGYCLAPSAFFDLVPAGGGWESFED